MGRMRFTVTFSYVAYPYLQGNSETCTRRGGAG